MPARLRLPLALLACVAASAAAAASLWEREQDDVRAEARERAATAVAGLEERAGAAVLALQGVRAAYDANGAVDARAFATYARVPLSRAEILAVGWAPRVGREELTTYPLVQQEPAPASATAVDFGADASLGEALRLARTAGQARFSAPVRLADGNLGVYAFVPVFARGAALDTPGQRRDALIGVVAGAIQAQGLVRAGLAALPDELDVRVVDGAAVLDHGPGGDTVARANVGGRTWRVSLAAAAPSPLVPLGALAAGALVALLLVGAAFRLHRRDVVEAALRRTLRRERHVRVRTEAKLDEEQVTRRLVTDASDALVLELDRDGIVRSCSPAVEALLGWSADELLGTDVYSLLHPDDLLSPPNGPQRYARKDGTYVVLDGRRISRRDELGFVAGVVAVLRGPSAPAARTAEQRMHDAVALEPDPVELFNVVAEEIALDLGVDAVGVVRFETGGFGTIAGACEPNGGTTVVPGTTVSLEDDNPAALVFRTGEPVAHAVPVRIGARLWGAIVAVGGDAARLRELGAAAQPVVAVANTAAQLSSLATRDALTNLPDARAFQEQLRAEARRAERHERELSLVLIDVDDFKRINAEQGRLAGDRALAEIGRRLAATVRNGELVSRISGDRFGWVLPETGGLNGWIAAERARRAVAATPIEGVDVTVSAGVCDAEDAASADELLALAELALGHAKESGGDATFRYSAELDGPAAAEAEDEDPGLARLRALARDLDAGDGAEGHSERVARLAEKLALSSGWPADRAIRLAQAALLHDVGKLGVDDDVLRKPGPLSAEELEQVQNHPDTGAELAVNALDAEQLDWIRQHHERWDGGGYPAGAAGEAISLGARLLAVAEAWDAMTSARVYGEALAPDAALAECRAGRGTQFAPDAVEALERLWALGSLSAERAEAAQRGE